MEEFNWLPRLVLLKDSEGNWAEYLEKIYEIFLNNFIRNETRYRGIKIAIKKHPKVNNKEATFWHLITEGKEEENREVDLRRCERIRWPKAIIEKCPDANIKVWRKKHKSDFRLLLWFEKANYLVVLTERKNYLLLWTAYTIDYAHRRKKLQKEYEKCK